MESNRAVVLAFFTLSSLIAGSCDEAPPRATIEGAPQPELELPETVVSYTWKGTTVDQQYGGVQTRMAVDSSGRPTVAYFAPAYEALPTLPDIPDLPITPAPRMSMPRTGVPSSTRMLARAQVTASPESADDLPWAGDGSPFQDYMDDFEPATFYHLRYAAWNGSYWTVEDVADVSHARGLSLLQTRNGYPIIAYLDSDHDIGPEWCSGAFLRVAIRTPSGWQMVTAAEPREVVDGLCTPGEDCPVCEVSGLDPVLAQGPGGTIGLAFRRARYIDGFLSNPDSDLAFVTLQLDGTTLTPGPVDVVHDGDGSGFFTAMQYATDDQGWQVPYLAYIVLGDYETRDAFGAWFARYDNTLDAWIKQEIEPWENWVAGAPLQMIIDGQNIYLLMYAVRAENTSVLLDLTLLHSQDGGASWDREYIASTGRSGGYPSLAMDSQRRLAVSFYQCGGPFQATCEPNTDGLMFGLRETSGWNIDTVLQNDTLLDGMFTALQYAGDKPVLACRSAAWRGPGGDEALEVYFGTPAE